MENNGVGRGVTTFLLGGHGRLHYTSDVYHETRGITGQRTRIRASLRREEGECVVEPREDQCTQYIINQGASGMR